VSSIKARVHAPSRHEPSCRCTRVSALGAEGMLLKDETDEPGCSSVPPDENARRERTARVSMRATTMMGLCASCNLHIYRRAASWAGWFGAGGSCCLARAMRRVGASIASGAAARSCNEASRRLRGTTRADGLHAYLQASLDVSQEGGRRPPAPQPRLPHAQGGGGCRRTMGSSCHIFFLCPARYTRTRATHPWSTRYTPIHSALQCVRTAVCSHIDARMLILFLVYSSCVMRSLSSISLRASKRSRAVCGATFDGVVEGAAVTTGLCGSFTSCADAVLPADASPRAYPRPPSSSATTRRRFSIFLRHLSSSPLFMRTIRLRFALTLFQSCSSMPHSTSFAGTGVP
jgi:hypothetical protein